jgi:hypothetical protein
MWKKGGFGEIVAENRAGMSQASGVGRHGACPSRLPGSKEGPPGSQGSLGSQPTAHRVVLRR